MVVVGPLVNLLVRVCTMNKVINVGVAAKLGKYSDAIQTNSVARWLYTSGTPGLNVGSTGQVNGDIRYGDLEVAKGGEIFGVLKQF